MIKDFEREKLTQLSLWFNEITLVLVVIFGKCMELAFMPSIMAIFRVYCEKQEEQDDPAFLGLPAIWRKRNSQAIAIKQNKPRNRHMGAIEPCRSPWSSLEFRSVSKAH